MPYSIRYPKPRKSPSPKAFNSDPDYYDIPAFLRKQANEPKQTEPEIKHLSPADVIEIANDTVLNKLLFTDFVKTMDQSLFDDEVSEVFTNCLLFLSKEQLWTIVLAWLLFHLEESDNWNEKTKNVIQDLANGMDAVKLNKAFRIFNSKMNDIGMQTWLSSNFNEVVIPPLITALRSKVS
jgi:hypothetical protein